MLTSPHSDWDAQWREACGLTAASPPTEGQEGRAGRWAHAPAHDPQAPEHQGCLPLSRLDSPTAAMPLSEPACSDMEDPLMVQLGSPPASHRDVLPPHTHAMGAQTAPHLRGGARPPSQAPNMLGSRVPGAPGQSVSGGAHWAHLFSLDEHAPHDAQLPHSGVPRPASAVSNSSNDVGAQAGAPGQAKYGQPQHTAHAMREYSQHRYPPPQQQPYQPYGGPHAFAQHAHYQQMPLDHGVSMSVRQPTVAAANMRREGGGAPSSHAANLQRQSELEQLLHSINRPGDAQLRPQVGGAAASYYHGAGVCVRSNILCMGASSPMSGSGFICMCAWSSMDMSCLAHGQERSHMHVML